MGDVTVVNPRGELVTIAEADLPTALDPKAGYRLPSDAEAGIAAEKDKAKALEERDANRVQLMQEQGYSPLAARGLDLIMPKAAWAAGNHALWEGATGGLSQVVTEKTLRASKPEWADSYTKSVQELREAYPERREVGNVVGNIARDAVLGAMGAPTIAGTVESGVGRGLAALGYEGGSALSRAGAAALRYGAGAGAESALLGATQEMSEEMLGPNVQLNAEKILAAAGEQGLYGAVFGAGLGAGGSLLKSGLMGGARMAGNAIERNAEKLASYADEQRWRTLDAPVKFAREAEARFPGGTKGVGKVMGKYEVAGIADAEERLAQITAAKELVGNSIGEIHATSPATMTLEEVLSSFERKMAPLEKQLGTKGVLRSAQELKEELASLLVKEAPIGAPAMTVDELYKMPIPVQDVIAQRKALDTLVFKEAKALDPNMRVGLLRDIRADLEGNIKGAIDKAAKDAGDAATGAKLKELAHDYQALSIAEDAAEHNTSRYATNRNLSMSDYLSGGTGAHIGSAVGSVLGPPGSFVGGLVGGAGAAYINRMGRAHGNAIAAMALDQMADLGFAMRAAKRGDQLLDGAAKGLVGDGGKRRALAGPYRSLARRYADAVEHTATLRSQQDAVVDRATSRPIKNAPNLSAAMSARAAQSVAYLASRLPPTLERPGLGTTKRQPRQSETEMLKFVTAYDAVRDPQRVLDNLAAGRVRREEIYALRDTSPEMFADLQKRTLEEVLRKEAEGKPLSHDQRLKLGIVLDIPADPSLEPGTLSRLQQSLQQSTKEEPQTAPRSPQGTDSQLAANGIDRIETM